MAALCRGNKIIKNIDIPSSVINEEELSYKIVMNEIKNLGNIKMSFYGFICASQPLFIFNNRYIIVIGHVIGEYGGLEWQVDLLLFNLQPGFSPTNDLIVQPFLKFEVSTFVEAFEVFIFEDGHSILILADIVDFVVLQLFSLSENFQLIFKEEVRVLPRDRFQDYQFCTQGNKVALVFGHILRIYHITSEVKLMSSIDLTRIRIDMKNLISYTPMDISFLYLSNNIIISTSDFMFASIDRKSKLIEEFEFKDLIPEQDRIVNFDDENMMNLDFPNFCYKTMIFSVRYFSCDKEICYGITNTGLIIDMTHSYDIVANLIEILGGDRTYINITKTHVCAFNKCLCVYDTISHKIFVYDMLHKRLVNTINVGPHRAFSVSWCGRYISGYSAVEVFDEDSKHDWKNITFIKNAFDKPLLNLRYFARLAVSKLYDSDAIKSMNLGRNMNYRILDDNHLW